MKHLESFLDLQYLTYQSNLAVLCKGLPSSMLSEGEQNS